MKISQLTPAKARGEGQLGFRHLDGNREQSLVDYNLLKGRHYMQRTGGMYGRGDRQPVNLLQQLIRTLTPFLAMNAPLADVTPLRADLEFEATVRKQIHDRDSQRLKLHEVYQDATTAAILSGVSFTLNGIKSGGDTYTSQNRTLDMGQEFVRLLDLDDVLLDASAKTLANMRLFGHRYSVARQDALDAVADGCYGAKPEDYEDGMLPNDSIATPEEATEILSHCTAVEGQPKSGERVDQNDGEQYASGERLEETILLWDLIFYMNGQVWIVTLPAEPGQQEVFGIPGGIDKFLACYQWRGPASGPVNALTFLRVPFNKMPLALAQMQRDLAEIADLLANKTFRQLIRTKNVVVYDGSAENMAMAMKKSAEGGYIRGNPQSVVTVKDGGLIADMMPGTQFFRDEWQNAVGNLALASGTGDTGKTATAFEGLMSRVQAFLDFLRTRVEQLATDDLRVRDWYLTQNPAWRQNVQQIIGQAPAAVTANVTVANPGAQEQPGQEPPDYVMQGSSEDFSTKVRMFSMQYTSPVISAQQIQATIETVVPVIIQMQATGAFNGRAAMSILARKLNEPELENLLIDPMLTMLQQQEQQNVMPGIDQDPTGQGDNQSYGQDQGPAGKRVPGKLRSDQRAMRPGPGQGSPRPMQMAQRPPQTAGAAA